MCISAYEADTLRKSIALYERQQAARREWDRITIPQASVKDKAHLFYLVA